MPFNAVDAARLLTGDILTDKEVQFLIASREGGDLSEKDENSDEFKNLQALGLVSKQSFSTPRSNRTLTGVAVTDDGQKLLNEIDNRYRENGVGVGPADHAPAGVDLEVIRQPTEMERAQVATTKEGREKALAHLKAGEKHKHTEQVKQVEAGRNSGKDKS